MTAVDEQSRNLLVMAGIGRPPVETGRHVVDVLMRTEKRAEQAADAQELLRVLLLRVSGAVEVLRAYGDHNDDQVRREAVRTALAMLTGDDQ